MSSEAVRSNIFNAWPDSPLIPAGEIGYKFEGLDLERDAIDQFFAGKAWKDVTWTELQKYKGDPSACLRFMSPAAYRYYLPSYMLVALDHYLESDVSAETAWLSLSPPTGPTPDQEWAGRVAGFSKIQKEAILSFLQFILHEHGANYTNSTYYKEALDNAIAYWEKSL